MRKILGLIIAVNIFELLIINFFPYPENFVYSYLTAHGFLPYKEILDQHFPGLLLLPINFYSLGMRTPVAARLWLFGVVIINHVLIYLISKKLFKSKAFGIMPNLIYAIFQPFYEGYVLWIDSIIPVFLLAGTYFLIKRKKEGLNLRRLFFSGLFFGIGIVFKQTVIPIVGIIFGYLLIREKDKRKAIAYIIFPFIFLTSLFLYFQGRGILADFYFWTVKFNITTFAEFGRKYLSFGDLVKTSLVFGLSGIGWLYLLVKDRSHNIIILGTLLLGGVFFAYARFDFVHLQPALPFGALIIILFLEKIPKNKIFFVGGLVWLIISLALLARFYKMNIGNKIYFLGDFEKKISLDVRKYAKPGESIFAFATVPDIYFLTDTFPSGHIFVFSFPWFMMEAQGRVLAGIVKDPPKVVIKDDNAEIDGKKFIDYMEDISDYIEKNYKTVDIIDGTKVMIHK